MSVAGLCVLAALVTADEPAGVGAAPLGQTAGDLNSIQAPPVTGSPAGGLLPLSSRRGTRVRNLAVVALCVVAIVFLSFWAILWLSSPQYPSCLADCVTDLAPALMSSGTCGSFVTTYNVSLNPSATATTNTFAAEVATSSGRLLSIQIVSNTTEPLGGSHCEPGAGSWYGVLWSSSGTAEALLGAKGEGIFWTVLPGNTAPVTVHSGDGFEVVSNGNVSADTLSFFGINGNLATGETAL